MEINYTECLNKRREQANKPHGNLTADGPFSGTLPTIARLSEVTVDPREGLKIGGGGEGGGGGSFTVHGARGGVRNKKGGKGYDDKG